jgi:hypothetical protein
VADLNLAGAAGDVLENTSNRWDAESRHSAGSKAADRRSCEGRFNRALILERIGIREKARESWQQFLDAERSSAWGVEARVHLKSLGPSIRFDPMMLDRPGTELVRRFPQESRTYGEGSLLCQWAAGDPMALSASAAAQV